MDSLVRFGNGRWHAAYYDAEAGEVRALCGRPTEGVEGIVADEGDELKAQWSNRKITAWMSCHRCIDKTKKIEEKMKKHGRHFISCPDSSCTGCPGADW
jgi:hypothetical protein